MNEIVLHYQVGKIHPQHLAIERFSFYYIDQNKLSQKKSFVNEINRMISYSMDQSFQLICQGMDYSDNE
jgi:hypothetical protein